MKRTFNLADLFEIVVDTVPDRLALVSGSVRHTYRDLEARTNRLAQALQARGLKAGDHVGLQLYNGHQYFESMLALLKIRCVPININYRYVTEELAYLYDNADLKGLFFEAELSGQVHPALSAAPACHLLIHGGEGDPGGIDASSYESVLAEGSPERDFGPRSGQDLWIIYTGGTTGMPRGVMWEHENLLFAGLQGGRPGDDPLETPEQLSEFILQGAPFTMHTAAPLIHGSAQFSSFIGMFTGGKSVLVPGASFIPEETARLLGDEGVTTVNLVGDAMGRPLAETFLTGDYKAPELFVVSSAGAVLSETVKQRLGEAFPDAMIMNNFGSSEAGHAGLAITDAGGQPKFFMLPGRTKILSEDGRECAVGEQGKIAHCGHLPLGYYKDEEKTAATFKLIDGIRYVLPGDAGILEEDGTVTLLGRGSVCINTGGEKVFPEEVEEGLKAHEAIFDAVVVGLADDRWGQRVTALVQLRDSMHISEEDVIAHARSKVAGYKCPKQVFFVERVPRHATGKPDYKTAQRRAGELAGE